MNPTDITTHPLYRRRLATAENPEILPNPIAVPGDKYEKYGYTCEIKEVTPNAVKYAINGFEAVTSTHAEFKRLEKKTLENGATFIPSPERKPADQPRFVTVVYEVDATINEDLGTVPFRSKKIQDYREGNYLDKFDTIEEEVSAVFRKVK